MTSKVANFYMYHNRIDNSPNDYSFSDSLFFRLSTSGNGGSIFMNRQGITITLKQCYFIKNSANRGGAIAVAKADLLELSKSCFDSNSATYSHNFDLNTLNNYDLGAFLIEDISEVGGNADHGDDIGSNNPSLCQKDNLTSFKCNKICAIHYSKGNIELIWMIVTNSTSGLFLETHYASGEICYKNTIVINACTSFFSFLYSSCNMLLEDSTFMFKSAPNGISGSNVVIKNCISNQKIGKFTYEVNPKIQLYETVACFNANDDKIYNGMYCISQVLALSLGVNSRVTESSKYS